MNKQLHISFITQNLRSNLIGNVQSRNDKGITEKKSVPQYFLNNLSFAVIVKFNLKNSNVFTESLQRAQAPHAVV